MKWKAKKVKLLFLFQGKKNTSTYRKKPYKKRLGLNFEKLQEFGNLEVSEMKKRAY